MRLKTFTYTSLAHPDLRERDVDDILAVSQHFNAIEGITGLLVFNGGQFLQVIEGPDASIDALVARLHRDRRHSGLEVRDERAIEMRAFPDWTLQLVKVSTGFQDAGREIAAMLPEGLDDLNRVLILEMVSKVGGPVTLPE